MTSDPYPDDSDTFGKTRSIVQKLVSRQVGLRAAKFGDIVAEGATTIREIGDELQKRRHSPATQSLTDSLAKATDDVAAYLRTTDGDALLRDIRSYGSTQPALAAAIAALAGFAAARVLKVSSIAGSSPATP